MFDSHRIMALHAAVKRQMFRHVEPFTRPLKLLWFYMHEVHGIGSAVQCQGAAMAQAAPCFRQS